MRISIRMKNYIFTYLFMIKILHQEIETPVTEEQLWLGCFLRLLRAFNSSFSIQSVMLEVWNIALEVTLSNTLYEHVNSISIIFISPFTTSPNDKERLRHFISMQSENVGLYEWRIIDFI